MTQAEWLTREQIDDVLGHLSAHDLIEAMGDGTAKGARMPATAFNSAAERAGYGEQATTRVRVGDFKYLVERIGEAVNVESPLSEGTASLLDSAISGG